jgi:hypothetical protein
MVANVVDHNLVAEGFHTSCGVELEFMSRIPKPRRSTKHYPYEFVTDLLNKGQLRFEFNDLSGAEKFDYQKNWTITPDETLKPEPSDPRAGSGQHHKHSMSPTFLTRKDTEGEVEQAT